MFIINSLDLATQHTFPEIVNVVRVPEGLTLETEGEGEILTPLLYPRMVHTYEGFELSPSEEGVLVQVLSSQGAMNYENGWRLDAEPPTFYTPEQIRQWLPRWTPGAIQFRLKLLPKSNDEFPVVQLLKIGYEVGLDPWTYCLDIALPNFLSVPVRLTRWVRPAPNGLSVPLPPDLAARRISTLSIFSPELSVQTGAIAGGNITIPTPIPQRQTQVLLDFQPRVDHAPGIYEVVELPCVILRALDVENARQIPNTDDIRLSNGMTRLWGYTASFDQLVEARVMASCLEDVRAIANHLMQRLDNNGCLEAFPFALEFPLQLKRGLRIEDSQQKGVPYSGSFRFAIIGLTEGENSSDVYTLETIERDISPKKT